MKDHIWACVESEILSKCPNENVLKIQKCMRSQREKLNSYTIKVDVHFISHHLFYCKKKLHLLLFIRTLCCNYTIPGGEHIVHCTV